VLDISLSLDIMIRSICFIDGMTIVQLTDEFVNGQTISSSIWREEIQNRNRLLNFGGKKFKIEIVSSIWREEIQYHHTPTII
jgi:hypothetical protein